MATYYSDTGLAQTKTMAVRAHARSVTAGVATAMARVSGLGVLAVGDVVRLVELPPNVRVLPHLSRVQVVTPSGAAIAGTLQIEGDNTRIYDSGRAWNNPGTGSGALNGALTLPATGDEAKWLSLVVATGGDASALDATVVVVYSGNFA